jgi:hypothetical protein
MNMNMNNRIHEEEEGQSIVMSPERKKYRACIMQ